MGLVRMGKQNAIGWKGFLLENTEDTGNFYNAVPYLDRSETLLSTLWNLNDVSSCRGLNKLLCPNPCEHGNMTVGAWSLRPCVSNDGLKLLWETRTLCFHRTGHKPACLSTSLKAFAHRDWFSARKEMNNKWTRGVSMTSYTPGPNLSRFWQYCPKIGSLCAKFLKQNHRD